MTKFKCWCGKESEDFWVMQNHMYYCEEAHKHLGIKESDFYSVKMSAINEELERQTILQTVERETEETYELIKRRLSQVREKIERAISEKDRDMFRRLVSEIDLDIQMIKKLIESSDKLREAV